jgi:uncharacterized protein YjbI with pentapeptide repeats
MDESSITLKENAKWDVFISYASSEVALAREVHRSLTGAGFTSFLSTDTIPDEIGSAGWLTTINKALTDCKWLVVVVTQESLASDWVAFEANHVFDAVKDGRKPEGSPIALWYDGPEPRKWIPTLQATQAIDMREPAGRHAGLEQLILRLKGSADGDLALINAKIRSLGAVVEQVERAGIRQPWWERSGTVVLLAVIVSATVLIGYLFSAYSDAWLADLTSEENRIQAESRFIKQEISQLRRDAMDNTLHPSTRAEILHYLKGIAGDEDRQWAVDLLGRVRQEEERARLVEVIGKIIDYQQKGCSTDKLDCPPLDLSGQDLSRLYMPAIQLSAAKLRYSKLDRAQLREGEFSGSDLRRASIVGALLEHAEFYEANLSGANLSGIVFRSADLLETDLSGAELRGANVMQDQLEKACGDKDTRLPERLTIIPCLKDQMGAKDTSLQAQK